MGFAVSYAGHGRRKSAKPREAGEREAREEDAPRGKLAPGARTARGLCGRGDVPIAADSPEVADVSALVVAGRRRADRRVSRSARRPRHAARLVAARTPCSRRRSSATCHPRTSSAWRRKIDETGAFLDPLIVVRGEDGRLWTPNGRHRLAAAKVLGLKQITALISPNETLAYRILALNTEKAHNLKDRSLEVIRMARNLAKREPQTREIAVRRGIRGRRSC